MWRRDGLPWLSRSDVLPPAGSRVTGKPSATPSPTPTVESPQPQSSPPPSSLRSAASWLRQMRALQAMPPRAAALALRRISIACCCLLILPSCSLLKPKPPSPPIATPAVATCPAVQCLDRALQVCEGVPAPPQVRSCADAVVLASDALGALLMCQEAQRVLIECVERHNAEVGRATPDR